MQRVLDVVVAAVTLLIPTLAVAQAPAASIANAPIAHFLNASSLLPNLGSMPGGPGPL